MTQIQAGIIGTGFIAGAHLEAVRRLGYAEVKAVSGSSAEKAQAFAKAHHIPVAYGHYQALIDDPDITVIHNCTPNHLHHEVNLAILRAGKHVLSEKPLTLTSAQSEELSLIAASSGAVHGVNFNYRQYPLVQHMKAAIASGEWGPIHLIHGGYLQDWMLFDTDFNWRLHASEGGRLRAVGDIGSHWMDLAQYVLGQQITAVMATLSTLHPIRQAPAGAVETFQSSAGSEHVPISVETEDFASIWLEFEGGTRASFVVSQVSAGRKNHLHMEVAGSTASAKWDQEQPDQLWIGRRDAANSVLLRDPSLVHAEARGHIHYPGGHGEAWADGTKNMMAAFYGAVRQGTDVNREPVSFATFHDGHQMMQVLDAVSTSAATGSWVHLL